MSYRDYREADLFRLLESETLRLADEALRGFFADIPAPDRFWQPRVDIYETRDSLQVKMEVAGVLPDSLRVVLSGDGRLLTVSGERSEETSDRLARVRCYQLEIYFGPFERKIALPPGFQFYRDGITAVCRDGLLVVSLPKREDRATAAHEIRIAHEGVGE